MDQPAIQIRAAEPRDAEAFHQLFQQPAVIAGTLQLPYPNESLWQQRLSSPRDGLKLLVAEVDGQVIGNAGLHWHPGDVRRHHLGGIGMAVDTVWHGRGVGSALLKAALDLAENWHGLTRIELEVYPDNERALALYQKFGFEQEGIARQAVFRGGQYRDVVRMARIVTRQR